MSGLTALREFGRRRSSRISVRPTLQGMGSAEELYKRLADAADVKLAAASTSLEQARIVGDLGIEGVMVVAVLLDLLTTRVDQLESETKKLKRKAKKRRA